MEILQVVVPSLLLLVPALAFLRNWKFADQQNRAHERASRLLLFVWIVLAVANGVVLWLQHRAASKQGTAYQALTRSENTLSGQITTLSSQNTRLSQQNAGLSGQNASLLAAVARLNLEITTKDERLARLNGELSALRKYSQVAGLTFTGTAYTGGDVTLPTAISPVVEGTYRSVDANRFRPVCDPDALAKDREAIKTFPELPFSYYALAMCLRAQGRADWRGYAKSAVTIFEQTTRLTGHQSSHDEALRTLRTWLDQSP
jgi:cell division protein FtsB